MAIAMKFSYDLLEKKRIGDRVIVIYNWDNLSSETCPPISKNVECFDLSGNKLWTVNGMDSDPYWSTKTNMFVGLKSDDSEHYLISFRGSSYKLDLETGTVVFEEYHK